MSPPKPFFILALDIDETLINGRSFPEGDHYDFNGDDTVNSATSWLETLHTVDSFCQEQGYQLIVHVISAKMTGTVDDTVDAVAHYLTRFLPVRNADGEAVYSGGNLYYAAIHSHQGTANEIFENYLKREKGSVTLVDSSQTILPAIHICKGNYMVAGDLEDEFIFKTSKAAVLESIRKFYGVSTAQVMLVDNDLGVQAEVQTGIDNGRKKFECIDSHELELLKTATKAERTRAAKDIQSAVVTRIEQKLAYLTTPLVEEVKEELLIKYEVFEDCLDVIKPAKSHSFFGSRQLSYQIIIDALKDEEEPVTRLSLTYAFECLQDRDSGPAKFRLQGLDDMIRDDLLLIDKNEIEPAAKNTLTK